MAVFVLTFEACGDVAVEDTDKLPAKPDLRLFPNRQS